MIKTASTTLFASGILFLVLGIHKSQVFGTDVSRALSGTAADNAQWMLVGGVVVAVIGFVGFLRESSRG